LAEKWDFILKKAGKSEIYNIFNKIFEKFKKRLDFLQVLALPRKGQERAKAGRGAFA
jgi:hypothetical protein